MTHFKRSILSEKSAEQVGSHLQGNLVNLIDVALQLKQAHWAVTGSGFQPVHEQLDAILDDVREGSDEVAERMATLGITPDGRSSTIAAGTNLPQLDAGFTDFRHTVSAVADILHATIRGLRESIAPMGDLDPISEDMLIGISAGLEKHFWMLQAQEL